MNSTQGHGTNQVNSTQSTGSSATPKDDEENIGNLNEGNRKEFPILGNQHTKNREMAVKEVIYPLVGNTTLIIKFRGALPLNYDFAAQTEIFNQQMEVVMNHMTTSYRCNNSASATWESHCRKQHFQTGKDGQIRINQGH